MRNFHAYWSRTVFSERRPGPKRLARRSHSRGIFNRRRFRCRVSRFHTIRFVTSVLYVRVSCTVVHFKTRSKSERSPTSTLSRTVLIHGIVVLQLTRRPIDPAVVIILHLNKRWNYFLKFILRSNERRPAFENHTINCITNSSRCLA